MIKKRMEKVSKEKANSGIEEKPSKPSGLDIQDNCTAQTIDDYQYSGNLDVDFTQLCALIGIKKIPVLRLQTSESASSSRPIRETNDSIEHHNTTWSPCLQIELDNEDSQSVKRIRISGWTLDELLTQVMSSLLPSLSNLQSFEMWKAGVTNHILTSLMNTISMCSNLRKVILEGNPLSEQSYHILMGSNSMIIHLSLRNNHIDKEGARLIGAAISNNKNLLVLNMAFNSVGDAGAMHIAQGLRFNQTLLCLSLASNQIGDAGATCLAEVIGPFALTHEEVVERRRLLSKRSLLLRKHSSFSPQVFREDPKSEQTLSASSMSSSDQLSKGNRVPKKRESLKKEEKSVASQKVATAGKKEDNSKLVKKSSASEPRSQGGKSDTKDKRFSVIEKQIGEVIELQSPLLDPAIHHIDGKVIYPGNTTLTSLNLSGNKLTPKSLEIFLSSLKCQGVAGLLRLSLNRNSYSAECDLLLQIQEVLSLKKTLKTNETEYEQ